MIEAEMARWPLYLDQGRRTTALSGTPPDRGLYSPGVERAFPPDIAGPFSAGSNAQQGAAAPYLKAVKSHPMIVVVVMLAAFAGSIAWLAHRTTNYKATADILFTPVPSDNNGANGLPVLRDSSDPTRLSQTASSLLHTPQAAGLAAISMGRGWTPTRVWEKITVQPQGQSNIISVSGESTSARTAQQLADIFATSSLNARRALLRNEVAGLKAETEEPTPAGDIVTQERHALLASLIAGQDPNFSLAQSAALPSTPTGTPAWLVILLALVAGFALASGAAVLTEMASDRIRQSDELLDLYPLPALAYVPNLPRRVRASTNGKPAPMPIAVREAYRMIRVQLDTDARPDEEGARLILITSGSSGDGKTTSAISIATALAEADHRVILMDLDLRKPDLGSVLRVDGGPGITSLLDEPSRLSLALAQGNVPRLSVLPAGPEASEDLLRPVIARMPEMIAQLREMADYVVIDTPPLGEVSDAYQLLPFVDEVIVVARPTNTRRASFQFMRDLLARANRTPLGMIIVGESPSRMSYAYYGQAQPDEPRIRSWLSRSRA
jgi:capsular exopolysaccharide synthesis family protein